MLSLLSKSETATKTDQRQENEVRIFHLYLVNLTVLDIQSILSSRIVVPALTSVPHFILHPYGGPQVSRQKFHVDIANLKKERRQLF